MTLPASGTLSFSQIQTEFTGSNPISLSEYYRTSGASYVQNIPANSNIPTSGTISVSNFYNGQGRLVATLTTTGNIAYFNLADALASTIGWDRVTPIDVTLNISGGHKIYSVDINRYGLVIPNFPNGSIVTINNSGFIAGAGGFPLWLGRAVADGGPALYVGFSNTVINNYNWIVGGGGAGGHPGQDTRLNEGGVDPVSPAGVTGGGNGGVGIVIQPPDLRIDWPRIYNYGVIAGGGGGGGGGQYQGVVSSCSGPGTNGQAGYEVRAPGGGGGAGQSYEQAYGGYFAFGRSACSTDGGDQTGFGGLGGNSQLLQAAGAGGNGTTRNGSGGAVAVGGAGGAGGSFGNAGGVGGSGGGGGGAGGYSKLTLSGTSSTFVQGDTRGTWA
jgi:hypothetical protein